MKILTVDVGGTNVKILASGQTERRRFPSGKTLTPARLVAGRIAADPRNLGSLWCKLDFAVHRLIEVLHSDDVVIGGGNAKKLKELPPGGRLGDNAFAFVGGVRMCDIAPLAFARARRKRVGRAATIRR